MMIWMLSNRSRSRWLAGHLVSSSYSLSCSWRRLYKLRYCDILVSYVESLWFKFRLIEVLLHFPESLSVPWNGQQPIIYFRFSADLGNLWDQNTNCTNCVVVDFNSGTFHVSLFWLSVIFIVRLCSMILCLYNKSR